MKNKISEQTKKIIHNEWKIFKKIGNENLYLAMVGEIIHKISKEK